MFARRLVALTALSLVLVAPGYTQDSDLEATEDEVANVINANGMIGCGLGASAVEKEGEGLFEVDDAICAYGQYDIKLNGAFVIMSATFDGPHDEEAVEALANEDEVVRVTDAIALFGCRVGDVPVEKESEDLFEIDDAVCEGGPFDIKLDGDFNVINMTRD